MGQRIAASNRQLRRKTVFTEEFIGRFNAKREIRGADECWPWKASTGGSGYPHMWCVIEGKRTCRDGHQIAWMIEHGREPIGSILHRCNNKLCTNDSHLKEGTQLENNHDAMRDGLIACKIDAAKASSIVIERQAGAMVIELAGKHGVKSRQIRKVLEGKAWAPVTGIHKRPSLQTSTYQLQFDL
jgi:hypothetical protein